MSKKVFYDIIKGYDMLYIQLNKDGAVLDILRRLKRNYGKIYLSGAIIDRVGNIPDYYDYYLYLILCSDLERAI